jgi:hypothetical protein
MIGAPSERLVNISLNILPFAVVFIYLLTFHQNIVPVDGDDTYFNRVYETQSLFEFLAERYNAWSGRLSVDTMMYFISPQLRLWRLLNSLAITMLCFNLVVLLLGNRFWLLDYRKTARVILFTCFGIGLINIKVLDSAFFWITGSFNYLWPIAAGSLALIPFREALFNNHLNLTARPSLWFVLPMLAVIFAGLGDEQVSLTLLLLMVGTNIALFINVRRVKPYLLLLTVTAAISVAILLMAPGNNLRYEFAITHVLPEFEDIAIGPRIFWSMRWLLTQVVDVNRGLLILLFGFIAISLQRIAVSRTDKILVYVATFIAGFLVISALNLDILHSDLKVWFDEKFFEFKALDEFVQASAKLGRNNKFYWFCIPYLIWVATIASIPFLIWKSCRRGRVNGLALAILFCTAIITLVFMFFSPTIFASGHRIDAMYSVILLFIVISLFYNVEDRIPVSFLLVFWLIAALNILFQHAEWSVQYSVHL